MKYASAYGIATVLFLAIDAIWLGVVARSFYSSRMGEIMLDQPRWVVALVFYVVYVAGLVYFAVSVGMEKDSVASAAFNGALFGFFCYLTYDATNLAVLRGYDPVVAVVDVIWGTVLSAGVAAGTIVAMRLFGQLPSPA